MEVSNDCKYSFPSFFRPSLRSLEGLFIPPTSAMRLLNVYTFKLSEFEGKEVPRYAVASHRWCENEATYVDVVEGKNKESEGYKKIVGFCEFVKWRNDNHGNRIYGKQNIEWIWIDTCCIDRRSSADISENITSM